MEKGTERESDRRRREVADYWCCLDQQRACRMAQASVEKLEHTGLLKRKEWPYCQKAVGKYARAAFDKRNKAVCPEH